MGIASSSEASVGSESSFSLSGLLTPPYSYIAGGVYLSYSSLCCLLIIGVIWYMNKGGGGGDNYGG